VAERVVMAIAPKCTGGRPPSPDPADAHHTATASPENVESP
jgi:hypothetical protein